MTRHLKVLNESKRIQAIECAKLLRLKPTDPGFDVQVQTLVDVTRRLIAARASFLACVGSI